MLITDTSFMKSNNLSGMGSEDAPAEVRIALVGEDGVGKSSLLMSLLEVRTINIILSTRVMILIVS